jgi:Protein of unknown function (DUF2829)
MSEQIYYGTKAVYGRPMTREQYNILRCWELPANENGADEGYLVEYLVVGNSNHPGFDNYISWSPKDVFERAYRPNGKLTFGDAIVALKAGRRVARVGWNGKGMYLWLLPEANVLVDWIREPHLKQIAEEQQGVVHCLPSIRMRTATGDVLTGWLASQSDMLSEDWEIIGEVQA